MNIRKIIAVEQVLQIANEAKDYAHSQILKGNTHPGNNKLPSAYFEYLSTSVRGRIGEERIGVRDIIDEKKNKIISSSPLERDESLAFFESVISVTSKYSLGNCGELAIQALDYILNKNSKNDINAEVYKISGGDHVFLVLNRDPDSDPHDPETWGSNAVICDPWSNKVYKASEYQDKLKNFRFKEGRNCIEDLQPWHSLSPLGNLNTNFLRQVRNVTNLKANFVEEGKNIINILKNYKIKLKAEKNRLSKNQRVNDQKILILANKIDEIKEGVRDIRDNMQLITEEDYGTKYRSVRSVLSRLLKEMSDGAVLSMQFTRDELSILFDKGKVMRLFDIESDTQKNIETMTEEANESLQNRLKR